MAHYKTYQTKVLKLNSTQAEAIATSESQFTIRGRKPTNTAKPISSTRYLCEIKDDGAFVKAVVV